MLTRSIFHSLRSPLSRIALASVAAFVAVTACHVADASAPERSRAGATPFVPALARGVPGQKGAMAAASAQLAVCERRQAATSRAVFGPRGGTLTVGGSVLYIPAGALRDTVTISAATRSDSTSTVDFEPSGLHFYKPLALALDATGCALRTDAPHAVAYVAPDGTVLETIPAFYEPRWKTVTAPIAHFSGYAIAF